MKCQNIAPMTKIKQVICADTFLQVLKNFHNGQSLLAFLVSESVLINKGFAISNFLVIIFEIASN